MMKTIKEMVLSALSGYKISPIEEGNIVSCCLRGNNCIITIKIRCDEEDKVMSVFGSVDLYVPSDRQAAVLKQINIINARNSFSALYMNPTDGQVICRCSCNTDGGALNERLVLLAFVAVSDMLDEAYLPLACARLGIQSELPSLNAPNEETGKIAESVESEENGDKPAIDTYNSPSQFCWIPAKERNL